MGRFVAAKFVVLKHIRKRAGHSRTRDVEFKLSSYTQANPNAAKECSLIGNHRLFLAASVYNNLIRWTPDAHVVLLLIGRELLLSRIARDYYYSTHYASKRPIRHFDSIPTNWLPMY